MRLSLLLVHITQYCKARFIFETSVSCYTAKENTNSSATLQWQLLDQFRDVASSAHVRTKQMKRKKYQRRGKAVAEKPLQLLQVMLLEKSYLTGTKPFAAQLRLDSTGDFFGQPPKAAVRNQSHRRIDSCSESPLGCCWKTRRESQQS